MVKVKTRLAESIAPSLHFGWLLDYPTKVPVNLLPKGLKSHTAILAQSGSGKSFALGRLLEEIASKTRARIVFLDPNSDFVKFSEVDTEAWKKPHLQEWFGGEDTLEEFQRRWSQLGFQSYTARDAATLGIKHPNAKSHAMSLSWEECELLEQASLLERAGTSTPEEFFAFTTIVNACRSQQESLKQPLTLEHVCNVAAALWLLLQHPEPQKNQWPDTLLRGAQGAVSPAAAQNLWGKMATLVRSRLWDVGDKSDAINVAMTSLANKNRVTCLDLGSLEETNTRSLAAMVTLQSVWKRALEDWVKALQQPLENDSRCPIFVVVDEAHNLAPVEAQSTFAEGTKEVLIRMATEGRKFGISLILVTQRPHRLDPNLLSQCDNLCLLKMNNLSDLDLVEKAFGFLPPGLSKRALDFRVGEALLAGNFVSGPTFTHVAPRRTIEGGRNLNDGHWTQDPFPLA